MKSVGLNAKKQKHAGPFVTKWLRISRWQLQSVKPSVEAYAGAQDRMHTHEAVLLSCSSTNLGEWTIPLTLLTCYGNLETFSFLSARSHHSSRWLYMSGSKIIPMAVHYLSWHHSFLALTSSRSTADPTLQQPSFTRWRASCTQTYTPTHFWDSPTADHSVPEACSHFPKHEQLFPAGGEPNLQRHVSDTCPCASRRVPPGPQRSHIKASLSLAARLPSSSGGHLCVETCQGDDRGGNSFLQRDFFTILQLCSSNPFIASL